MQWYFIPLHAAACYGHEEIVYLLLKRGAHIDRKDRVSCIRRPFFFFAVVVFTLLSVTYSIRLSFFDYLCVHLFPRCLIVVICEWSRLIERLSLSFTFSFIRMVIQPCIVLQRPITRLLSTSLSVVVQLLI